MSFLKTIQSFHEMTKIAKLKLRLHNIETVSKAIQKENKVLKDEISKKDEYIKRLEGYLREAGWRKLWKIIK